ncbi:uncharacterized protein A4U43_C09F2800 [Asparagus officinalis]|uniref:Uncharacterized protein n=1 Tax=Asparagus officinalis TaxID=4686 RepID=A0A5P1E6N5_ASPOF|nr:uncharacterized protein A4U43_C09F2800 [Asparagus officinalis]
MLLFKTLPRFIPRRMNHITIKTLKPGNVRHEHLHVLTGRHDQESYSVLNLVVCHYIACLYTPRLQILIIRWGRIGVWQVREGAELLGEVELELIVCVLLPEVSMAVFFFKHDAGDVEDVEANSSGEPCGARSNYRRTPPSL